MDVRLEVKERFNYMARSIVASMIVFIVIGAMLFLGGHRYHIGMAANAIIAIAATCFVFYYMDDPLGTRYFLLSFEVRDDLVYISYKDKTTLHEINGKRKDFKAAKVKGRSGRYGSPSYLEIRFKGQVLVKQYFYRGWSEEKIDEIVSYT